MRPSAAPEPRPRWIDLALRRDVVRRSLRVALVVGNVLVAINYADRIASGAIGPRELFNMALT